MSLYIDLLIWASEEFEPTTVQAPRVILEGGRHARPRLSPAIQGSKKRRLGTSDSGFQKFIDFLFWDKKCGLGLDAQFGHLVQNGMSLRIAAFRELREGNPGDLDSVLDLATALNLDAVDRAELLIHYGEALLGGQAYYVDIRLRKRLLAIWQHDFDFDALEDTIAQEKEAQEKGTVKKRQQTKRKTTDIYGRRVPTEIEMKPTTIHSLNEFLVAQRQHQTDVAAGVKSLVAPLMKEKDIRTVGMLASHVGVGRQHLSSYLSGKKLISPVAFRALCDALNPESAILMKMRALYVDAVAGHHLLNLSFQDFELYYNPDRQRRLTSWLMAIVFAGRPAPTTLPEAKLSITSPGQDAVPGTKTAQTG